MRELTMEQTMVLLTQQIAPLKATQLGDKILDPEP